MQDYNITHADGEVYSIYIYCLCGCKYETTIGSGRFKLWERNNLSRWHTCPSCKAVWDLAPNN